MCDIKRLGTETARRRPFSRIRQSTLNNSPQSPMLLLMSLCTISQVNDVRSTSKKKDTPFHEKEKGKERSGGTRIRSS